MEWSEDNSARRARQLERERVQHRSLNRIVSVATSWGIVRIGGVGSLVGGGDDRGDDGGGGVLGLGNCVGCRKRQKSCPEGFINVSLW